MPADILITGASSGIGRALVVELTKQGHRVWGLARRHDLLVSLKNDLTEDKFFYSVGDVTKPETLVQVKQAMREANFRPKVFILGAATFESDLRPNFQLEIFKQTINTNLIGPIMTIEAFLDDRLADHQGHFILLSSVAAFRPNRKGIAYPASKSAASLALRGFNLHYRPRGLSFTNIYLGPVATAMWEGPKSWLVADQALIAKAISRHLTTSRSQIFLPFFSTLLFRFSRLLPDKFYTLISGLLK
jgi:short-subunit dehydrogenase